ncbi:major facilitator superfamily domain-containing protein, partial [Bisporella sp. PMI_857]
MYTKDKLATFLLGKKIGNAPPPDILKLRSSEGFIISTIAIAVFTDTFLYSLVVPVLPFALEERAAVRANDLQKWISIFLSVYGGALAFGSPPSGWLADRWSSRRTPLLLGLFALGGSTVLLCLGHSLFVLLLGRICQALSACIVWTVGLALLTDTVESEKIGQAMGYVSSAFSVGSICGPLLGGVVYARAGYYAVYGMGFAIVGVDILMRMFMVEKSVAAQWSSENDIVSVTTTADVAQQADSHTSQHEIRPIPIIDTKHSSEIIEKHTSLQSLPAIKLLGYKLPPMLALLRIPRLLVSLFGCFTLAVCLSALDAVLPIYVNEIFQWDSLGAGLIFLNMVVPQLTAPFFGYLSDRYGSRYFTALGFTSCIPFWICLRFVISNTIAHKVLLCVLLSGIGFGLTMGLPALMAEIDHVVQLEEKKRPGSLGKKGGAAQGYALFNMAFAIGTIVGPLWAGFVIEQSGWGTVGWSLSIICGATAAATFWWAGGRIMLKKSTIVTERAVDGY